MVGSCDQGEETLGSIIGVEYLVKSERPVPGNTEISLLAYHSKGFGFDLQPLPLLL